MVINNHSITITTPKDTLTKIDALRKDVSRSRFISRIIEMMLSDDDPKTKQKKINQFLKSCEVIIN